MKYGSTSRTVVTFFHGLLALGGGILAAYFGFFVLPTHFLNATAFIETYVPLNLKLELAVIGLVLFLVDGYGFFHGLKSMINPSDDKPVLKSFAAFITVGYLAALFFLLNGAVFFGVVDGNNSANAFVIVVALLLAIGLLIAANVPMVRLFDGKEAPTMYKTLSLGFVVNAFSITLFSVFALISQQLGPTANLINQIVVLLMYIGFSAGVGALVLVSYFLIGKNKGVIPGVLVSVAVIATGAFFATIGGLEIGWPSSLGFHFSSWSQTMSIASSDLSYGIASLVFGILAVIAGFVCLGVTLRPAPEKKAQ